MLNAAQTEMHAVVRGGAVAEWIEHPPVFIHFSITGNICDWKIFYSPWCPLCEQWQHLWGQGEKWIYLPVARYISIYLGLQLAIRDQSRTAERWLNVLFGLAAGRHWRCDTGCQHHGDQVSHTVAISTSPHPGSRSQLGLQSISY